MTVTLIIPAYNEAERLPRFLDALSAFLKMHPDLIHAIFVVDDGSKDNTGTIAEAHGKHLPAFRLLTHAMNRGKGAAIQTGINAADTDAIVFLDADGATAPEELPGMLARLADSPIVVGNRWAKNAETRGQTALRSLSSMTLRSYMGLFGLGDIDTMCGCKAYRRDVAVRLFNPLLEERWLFDQEVLFRARLLGLSIASVPIHWTSQRGSKLRPTTLLLSAARLPIVLFRTWVGTKKHQTRTPSGSR